MIISRDQAEVLLKAHRDLIERLVTVADALALLSEASTKLTEAVLSVAEKQEDREVT